MKSKILFIFLILLSGILISCANDKENNDYTFIDSLGNEITLNEKPKKVACLFSSYAQIWQLSGGDVFVTVKESIDRGFCNDDVILVDDASGHFSIDMEVLIESDVDFVIGTTDYNCQVEACRMMNSIGIPSALFKVESFDDYLKVLKICTDITGDDNSYIINGLNIQKEIDEIKNKVLNKEEKIEILFLRAGSSSKSTKAKNSNDNFACRMLKELNTINIADDAVELVDNLSLEYITIKNPDYIFISPMGIEELSKAYINELFKKDGWKDLDAVKNNRYIFLSKDLFHYKPNNRWAESYKVMYDILYENKY